MRIRSSSSETKNFEAPGSPWRPERPRSWLSMRRLSCRSLPMTKRPPASHDIFARARRSRRGSPRRARSRSAGSSIAASSAAQPHVEIAAELDVGAAAGHVGGDRHRAGPAGLGDDVGFLLVVAGVQHVVRDLVLLEERRQRLGFLDADGADQHRLLALAAFEHLLDDRVVFLARRCGRPRRRCRRGAPARWSGSR